MHPVTIQLSIPKVVCVKISSSMETLAHKLRHSSWLHGINQKLVKMQTHFLANTFSYFKYGYQGRIPYLNKQLGFKTVCLQRENIFKLFRHHWGHQHGFRFQSESVCYFTEGSKGRSDSPCSHSARGKMERETDTHIKNTTIQVSACMGMTDDLQHGY